ncbi:unnamed protein product [Polarella glacialis]|uniref:Uncharacterized protein n=1 Tax=Polarella glacialis TaxID=89957 RepID=A0A813GUT1_POLGL|nr:unnamed protein product [Polarella glacialis]
MQAETLNCAISYAELEGLMSADKATIICDQVADHRCAWLSTHLELVHTEESRSLRVTAHPKPCVQAQAPMRTRAELQELEERRNEQIAVRPLVHVSTVVIVKGGHSPPLLHVYSLDVDGVGHADIRLSQPAHMVEKLLLCALLRLIPSMASSSLRWALPAYKRGPVPGAVPVPCKLLASGTPPADCSLGLFSAPIKAETCLKLPMPWLMPRLTESCDGPESPNFGGPRMQAFYDELWNSAVEVGAEVSQFQDDSVVKLLDELDQAVLETLACGGVGFSSVLQMSGGMLSGGRLSHPVRVLQRSEAAPLQRSKEVVPSALVRVLPATCTARPGGRCGRGRPSGRGKGWSGRSGRRECGSSHSHRPPPPRLACQQMPP